MYVEEAYSSQLKYIQILIVSQLIEPRGFKHRILCSECRDQGGVLNFV